MAGSFQSYFVARRVWKNFFPNVSTFIWPTPDTTTWKEFIRSHMEMLWATDFFSTEVWTLGGLVTFYVLFFIKLDTREVHIAGVTPHPGEAWMRQVARNLTMEEWGILKPTQYLIHDRDTKFCAAFKQILDDAGVKRLPLPPRSPWLNGYAERWVKSVKDEALSRVILFGEGSLRHVLGEYVGHYHTERCHQGLGNVIPYPAGGFVNLLRALSAGGIMSRSSTLV